MSTRKNDFAENHPNSVFSSFFRKKLFSLSKNIVKYILKFLHVVDKYEYTQKRFCRKSSGFSFIYFLKFLYIFFAWRFSRSKNLVKYVLKFLHVVDKQIPSKNRKNQNHRDSVLYIF